MQVDFLWIEEVNGNNSVNRRVTLTIYFSLQFLQKFSKI